MSENRTVKTPEPPKLTFMDENALAKVKFVSSSQRRQLKERDNYGASYSENRFRTPSATTFNVRPTFGASGSKPTSQSEDLATRYKRMEDSGLLRQLRQITLDEEDEDDEDNKKANNLICSETNSGSCEYQRVNKTLNKDFAFNVNIYKDVLKNTKPANLGNEKEGSVASRQLPNKTTDKVVNSAPLPLERSIARQSKSEPELVNVKRNDEVDPVKHKTVESNPVQINATLVKSSSTSKLSNSTENELKSFRINDKVYYKLNKLGQGGSSCVYQVYEPSTQKTLALKAVDLSKVDETTRKGFMNEIKLLLKLRHCERVVKLYDYCKVNSYQLIMIMEKGDSDLGAILRQFVETKKQYCLDPLIIKHYWKEMLKAVDEIHKLDVVHSDLKPVNFISVGGKLKLIDFGIANAIDNDQTSVIKDTQIGTVNYMAPESLSSKQTEIPRKFGKPIYKFNCKADIWSLGCILYNLVYGIAPFGHLQALYAKVQAICDPKFVIQYPPYDNQLIIECIKLCLNRDASKRPSAEQLLNHPYLKESANPSPNVSQLNDLYTRINSLTPNRINKLSQVISMLSQSPKNK